MELFARMGGAPPSGEAIMYGCGCCPILPLVVVLCGFAVLRQSLSLALLALLIAGLLLAYTVAGVSQYEPPSDWEVESDQAIGWGAVWLYTIMTVLAFLSVLLVIGRRLFFRQDANITSGSPDG